MKARSQIYSRPRYYDVAFGYRDFEKECRFVVDRFVKINKTKAVSICDIGCGTGNHLIFFQRLGLSAWGIDISDAMIDYVRQKSLEQKTVLNLKVADMRTFTLPVRVDIATCFLETLSYLTENKDIYAHFKSVHSILNRDGIYVLELANPADHIRQIENAGIPEVEWSRSDGNIEVYSKWKSIETDPLNQFDIVEVTMVAKRNRKEIDSYRDIVRHRMFFKQELECLVKDYFNIVSWYGALDDGTPLSASSDKMVSILQAKKS